ncbi:hypothetical protein SRB5_41550 [Streptomyces sp. RB5]|uniref:Secreted protein n=1 Tax=Streptomyces smaragdinus TaxID=2585196 RepID=A0A7K0CKG3_9ACTN|nr:hypothetical protein [Streptomyces smaragdinus]MQY13995.1 hypothetical protein [Streptomyces smaragdinus]
MQSLPGAADLPHTRTSPLQWLLTAVAVAAVVAAGGALTPDGAHAADGGQTGPDAAAADYPLDCGERRPVVTHRASADLDHDGRAETVAVVRCETGLGTAPSSVYVLAGPGEPPRVLETLLDAKQDMSVGKFAVRDGEISATLLGYSADAPRCCPDRERDVEWHWENGRFVLEAQPVRPAGVAA